MRKIYDEVEQTAKTYGSNAALIYMNKKITYSRLMKGIDDCAAALTLAGVRAGDTVALCLPNTPEAVYLLYAVSKIGCTAYPIHPLTPQLQMRGFLARGNAKCLVCLSINAADFAPAASDAGVTLIYVSAAESLGAVKRTAYNLINKSHFPAFVLSLNKLIKRAKGNHADYSNRAAGGILLNSGGTSGEPKIIRISDAALTNLARKGPYALATNDIAGKFMLSALPYFHGFGLCMGIHALLCHGGCNVILPKFHRKDAVRYLCRGQITYIIGVPVLYDALLSHPKFSGERLKKIHVAFVGGDFVPHKLLKAFDKRVAEGGGSARLLEGYGLTETVTVACVNTLTNNRDRSVGQPLPGIEIAAFDFDGAPEKLCRDKAGELAVCGDTLMDGYFGDEAATNAVMFDYNGKKWVRTGDYGYVDADGYVFFKQRLKRIFKVSGVNVFPSEIEQLAVGMPGVETVCAVAVPDERRGSAIKLYLAAPSLGEAEREVTRDSLIKQITDNLSPFACPSFFEFRDSLPLTSVGKVDVNKLT